MSQQCSCLLALDYSALMGSVARLSSTPAGVRVGHLDTLSLHGIPRLPGPDCALEKALGWSWLAAELGGSPSS